MRLNTSKLQELMARRGMSSSALASAAGVSRTTLGKLTTQDSPTVYAKTVRKLANALGVSAETLDPDGLETIYCQRVTREHEHTDLGGLGFVVRDDAIPIDRVFMPPRVNRPREENCTDSAPDGHRSNGKPSQKRRPLPLPIALRESHRLFLLGEPGAGKTTTLRYLAWMYASSESANSDYPSDVSVPVFVRLADWAEQLRENPKVDIVSAALAQLDLSDRPDLADWLHGQLAKGRVLLLLDGLDEVGDADHLVTVKDQIRVVVEAYPEARVVITSRLVGFTKPKLGRAFDVRHVESLSKTSIRRFVRAWCAVRHGHPTERKCEICDRDVERLRHAVVDNARIAALAQNPMILTMLCMLYKAGASLPRQRWQLYERICEAFLVSWEEKKGRTIVGSPDRATHVEDREIRWILESIALEMQKNDRTLVSRWWLCRSIESFLRDELRLSSDQAAREAESLMRSLHQRSGLLVERGPERYAFRHKAIQEYLASRAILQLEDPIESIREYIYHPSWNEVVRLVAAQLDRRRVPQFLRLILDDPDPTGRFIRRGLLMVLGCLADGASLFDESLISQIEEEARQLGETKWLGFAFDAFEQLSEMRSTRLEAFALRSAEGIYAAAEKSLPDFYSVQLLFAQCEADLVGMMPETNSESKPEEGPAEIKPVEETTLKIKDSVIVKFTGVKSPEGFGNGWTEAVFEQLTDDPSARIREICALELGRFEGHKKKVCERLMAAFDDESDREVREAIVEATRKSARQKPIRQKLLRILENDEDEHVRAAAAGALRSIAVKDSMIRAKLVGVLSAPGESVARAGAASALSPCVSHFDDIRELLVTKILDENEDEHVRAASLHSIDHDLPSLQKTIDCLKNLVSGSPDALLPRVAAQVLAEYATRGSAEWSSVPIEQIERVLVSIKKPCPHALEALRALVDTREVRRLGILPEKRLERALADVRDSIDSAFVFGSAASNEQGKDSDVDLMVIGDVTLKELTPGLRSAEEHLGRQVNVVIYSPGEWRRRLRERIPFAVEVQKSKKRFVIGGHHELAAMA
ncbi:MAG: NACHT domain-containing protein [Planctomycetes bacterium]|nr:NACHT domain-containing protein [Planctomycetota bacterium]